MAISIITNSNKSQTDLTQLYVQLYYKSNVSNVNVISMGSCPRNLIEIKQIATFDTNWVYQ